MTLMHQNQIQRGEPSGDGDAGFNRLGSLSDDELLRRLSELLQQSRRVESELVAHIGEVDERRLYARKAASSMFAYCTEILHLSEHEAYLRISVARAARQHPLVLAMLADGRLHLIGIAKLAPYLTVANRGALLRRAAYQSKRQIEELIAELAPRPEAPALTRELAARQDAGTAFPAPANATMAGSLELCPDRELGLDRVVTGGTPSPERAPVIQPLAPARYKIQFTASAAFLDKLERLKALMRASVPSGDLAAILEDAVTEKLERLEARRFGKSAAPRKGLADTETSASSSRYIPAAVRRAVHQRDGGRCRYKDDHGRRCSARERLEFHHIEPYARGGDRSPNNIRLMCRAHNVHLAECDYGKDVMARYRKGDVPKTPAVPQGTRAGPRRAPPTSPP